MASRTVAMAMSGGVDSTVAALLLKKKGFDLVGVFMHNWDQLDETGTNCSSDCDYQQVQRICRQIGIPCYRANLVKEYWSHVFSSLLEGICRGWTPNPDVLCNRFIKFQAFLSWVQSTLGVTRVATGHYARLKHHPSGHVRLLMATDPSKDQTYFLSQVSQEALQHCLFPVGGLLKVRVREIAREAGFDWVNQQQESMGLCFIGKREFSNFISEYVERRSGDFISMSGQVVGRHEGHQLYTIGQRARLGGYHQPYCVASKDPGNNTVTVVEGMNHPALYTHSFTTLSPHWITYQSHDLLNASSECMVQHRYRHKMVDCTVTMRNGRLHVTTREPLRAVTPGQYAVFYRGVECLGGACIVEPGPSLNVTEIKDCRQSVQ